MKAFFSGLLCLLLFTNADAQSKDLPAALAEAKAAHRQVLLRFSGSDWCIPCIRMEKELFSTSVFHNYADSNLVLLAADFPRLKKHQLPQAQQAENARLADRYNPDGSFPLLVLLDADGHVLRRWEGGTTANAASFVDQLAALKNAPSTYGTGR